MGSWPPIIGRISNGNVATTSLINTDEWSCCAYPVSVFIARSLQGNLQRDPSYGAEKFVIRICIGCVVESRKELPLDIISSLFRRTNPDTHQGDGLSLWTLNPGHLVDLLFSEHGDWFYQVQSGCSHYLPAPWIGSPGKWCTCIYHVPVTYPFR